MNNNGSAHTWKIVERFYHSQSSSDTADHSGLLSIIKHIRNTKADSALFANTSHEALMISPFSNATSKDCLRVFQEGNIVTVEFFDASRQEFEVVGASEADDIETLIGCGLARLACR